VSIAGEKYLRRPLMAGLNILIRNSVPGNVIPLLIRNRFFLSNARLAGESFVPNSLRKVKGAFVPLVARRGFLLQRHANDSRAKITPDGMGEPVFIRTTLN